MEAAPTPDVWELASARDFAALVRLVDDQDEVTRRSACFVLGYLAEQGSFDLDAMRKVIPLLSCGRPEVRATAAYVIGECSLHGLLDTGALPALHSLLEDRDAEARKKALSALAWLATKQVRDADTLVRFNRSLGDREADVRMTAAASLAIVARSGLADRSSIAPLELLCTDAGEVALSGLGVAHWNTTVGKMASIALAEVRKRLPGA